MGGLAGRFQSFDRRPCEAVVAVVLSAKPRGRSHADQAGGRLDLEAAFSLVDVFTGERSAGRPFRSRFLKKWRRSQPQACLELGPKGETEMTLATVASAFTKTWGASFES